MRKGYRVLKEGTRYTDRKGVVWVYSMTRGFPAWFPEQSLRRWDSGPDRKGEDVKGDRAK